jgi:hypothetical protein
MNPDLQVALDECLQLLQSGTDVSRCLAIYPQHASELRPLLELAAAVRKVDTPVPADAARAAGLYRILEAAAAKRASRSKPAFASSRSPKSRQGDSQSLHWNVKLALQMTFAAVIVLAVIISGTVVASAATMPGDALYPVKLAAQQAQLTLTFDEVARQQLEGQFGVQQRVDVQRAVQAGRQAEVHLQGWAEQIAENVWVVNGLAIKLEPGMTVVGQPRLGAWVNVRARLPGDGSVVATQVVVTEGRRGQPPESPPHVTAEPAGNSEPADTPSVPGPKPKETPIPKVPPKSKPTDVMPPQARPTDQPKLLPEPKATKEPKPTQESKPAREPKPPREPRP